MNDPSEHCPRIAPIPLCEKRKKMFNTNALHNLLNVSITLSALIVAILLEQVALSLLMARWSVHSPLSAPATPLLQLPL